MSHHSVVFAYFVKENEENKKRTPLEWGEAAGLVDFYPSAYQATEAVKKSIQGKWMYGELICDMYIEKYEDCYCIEFIFPKRRIQDYKMPEWNGEEKVPFEEDPRMPIAHLFGETAENLGAEIAFYRSYLEKLVEFEIQEDLQAEYNRSIKEKNLNALLMRGDWKILYLSGEWLKQTQRLEQYGKRYLYTEKWRMYFASEGWWRF